MWGRKATPSSAITQIFAFPLSFLRRNWKQSNTTEKHMEIIIMAQKQKQKSFYVPCFNKRKSAWLTWTHAPRQGLGLILFLFISQFPCLFSFFPLPVAARAARAGSSIQNQQAALDPDSHSMLLFETQIAVSLWTWKKLQVFSKGKGSKSPQSFLEKNSCFWPQVSH